MTSMLRQRYLLDPRRDGLTDAMGLPTFPFRLQVAVFVLSCAALAVVDPTPVNWPVYLLGLVLATAGVTVAARASGDPVDTRSAVLSAVLSMPAFPAILIAYDGVACAGALTIAGVGALSAVLLMLRGAMLVTLAAMALYVAMGCVVGIALGIDPVPQLLLHFNLAPSLSIVGLCAIVARPAVSAAMALRTQITQEAAAGAAQAAALRERDAQLGRLDSDAREMLERIAVGEEFSIADVRRCRLIQARLRDGIRAPSLDSPELSDAVWAARDRGVRVTLLDDRAGGADTIKEELARVHASAIDVIAGAKATDEVTVRVLPMGREHLATIVSRSPDGGVRREFSLDGSLT
ncbi:hypothetical protein GII33_17275 [Gordonia pseudamarae]|jgi:hypothetical protein|uniref:FUSC family protein n=1 Tax=Gordonia pseudamarae TaxID=2831662 RepID=A0ABX6IK94_9ACTN|nr:MULTISPECIES: hypothetical protein [Gordonia]MBD0020587.1 hypothetical protein [Gordonia sp. (in: high G+C Gram-positive bacteria)]QHN27443.1 hypothetical protein GII33_17275 [Gordonia pseudamarae]QHN36327.1 hypothetical protein GII31_17050 [Gordonia pseudamarae]